jgi:hypothetical protein
LTAIVTSFYFFLFIFPWAEAFSGPFALALGTGTPVFPFMGLYAISDRSSQSTRTPWFSFQAFLHYTQGGHEG